MLSSIVALTVALSHCSAIHFLLLTGCRPSEAAYVVIKRTIVVNDYHVKYIEHTFKATAPAVITKTTRDYFWLLPNELNTVSNAIIRHTDSGYDDFYDLKESLRKYWIDMVLKKANVAT